MKRGLAVLIVVASTAVAPAAADSFRDLLRRGNTSYDAGRYAEALREYEHAAALGGDGAVEATHNRADVLFRLGRLDEARELWSRIAATRDAAFEARTFYNLGNCDYAEALASAEPPGARDAMRLLDQAAGRYREALRLDPTLIDARANLELAGLLRRQLEQQSRDESQDSDESGRSPDDQAESGDQSAPTDEPQPSESESTKPPEPQESPDSPPHDPPPFDQPSEPIAPDEEPAAQSDQSPSHEERGAQSPASESAVPPPSPREPIVVTMTRAEAERLLQMVRDAEKQRRAALARQRATRAEPVERDW